MKKYKDYESPHIEVLEVKVEKGFAQTGDTEDQIWGSEGQWKN